MRTYGIIAVICTDYPEKALHVEDAVHKGGIKATEITMSAPSLVKTDSQ